MKKLLLFICSLFMVMTYAADINLMSHKWIISGKKGTVSNGEISWENLSPSGRYKLVILRLVLPKKINASALENFCSAMRITSADGKPVSVKLEASSYKDGKSGYLYGTPRRVNTNGGTELFEINLHERETYGVMKDYTEEALSELRIVIIGNSLADKYNIVLSAAHLGSSVKKSLDDVKKQLKSLKKLPVVPVVRTAEDPIINGKLDDPAWKNAFVMSHFYTLNGAKVKEPTEFSLLYDEKNIYIGVKAYAAVLDPVNNLLDTFKAVTVKHDGPTYDDDCIEVFFSGSEDKRGHIVANINTTYERIVSIAGVNAKWNPAVQMKAQKFVDSAKDGKGGFFCIEMAIPRAELKQFAAKDGSMTFNIARQNRHLEELSCFVRSASFHNKEDYAKLAFTDLNGSKVAELQKQRGKIALPYDFGTAPSDKLHYGLELNYSPVNSAVMLQSIKQKKGKLDIAPAQNDFIYSVIAVANGKVICRTPQESFGEGQSVVQGKYKLPAGSEIFVNGKKISNNIIGLVRGKNVIAVKTSDAAKISITFPFQQLKGSDKWSYTEKADNLWHKRDYNDNKWTFAVPPSKKTLYLRKVIFVEHSALYPFITEKYPLRGAKDSVQPFSFIMNGIPEDPMTDYRLYVEVPAEVKFYGASGANGKAFKRSRCTWSKLDEVVNNGKKFTRYEIKYTGNVISQPGLVKYGKLSANSLLTVALTPLAEAGTPDVHCYYYMTANGGRYTELKRRFTLQILPAFANKSPKRMKVMTWLSFRDLDDKQLFIDIVKSHAAAGFNIGNSNSYQRELIEPSGMKYCARFNFEAASFNSGDVLKKYPHIRFINDKGQVVPLRVPFYQIVHNAEFRKDLQASFNRYLDKTKCEVLDWDYEFDPHAGHYTSYDEATLKAFAAKYGISEKLDPAVIRKKYNSQWVDFMVELTAGVVKFLKEETSKRGIWLDLYSGYPSDNTRKIYGVDFDLIMPHLDFAMMGYGRPLEGIRKSLALSKKYNVPVLFGFCSTPYSMTAQKPQDPVTPAVIMRRFIDSTFGVMYWGHSCSDGQLLHSFNEVNRLMHDVEDMVMDGKRAEAEYISQISGIDSGEAALFKHRDGVLLVVINQTNSDKNVVVSLKKTPEYSGFEFYSGKKFAKNAKEIKLKIKAGTNNAVIFRKR